jgi:hypothetical protein
MAGPKGRVCRGMVAATLDRRCRLNQALAFTALVHERQKRDGLWLAEHPFVHSVRAGSASPEDLARWVRQIYCITGTYAGILRSMCPPPPVGVWSDPWRDMAQLIELAGGLGVGPPEMASPRTNRATRAVQIWLRHNLTNRSQHIAAQVCWALVEAMSPEAAACLAEGAVRHFDLKAKALAYFKIGMISRRRSDRYAANLLTRIAMDDWRVVQEKTLLVSRLMVQLYASAGEACAKSVTERFDRAEPCHVVYGSPASEVSILEFERNLPRLEGHHERSHR